MSKDFNLNQKLTLYLDNGVNSFKYDVTDIDFVGRQVSVVGEAGERSVFSFDMVHALGSVKSDEPSADDEPKNDDKPINLDDIPF